MKLVVWRALRNIARAKYQPLLQDQEIILIAGSSTASTKIATRSAKRGLELS